jgi:hypothetical protein
MRRFGGQGVRHSGKPVPWRILRGDSTAELGRLECLLSWLTRQPFQGIITSELEGTVALWASILSGIQTRLQETFRNMV